MRRMGLGKRSNLAIQEYHQETAVNSYDECWVGSAIQLFVLFKFRGGRSLAEQLLRLPFSHFAIC
jgi:hypothetical protein